MDAIPTPTSLGFVDPSDAQVLEAIAAVIRKGYDGQGHSLERPPPRRQLTLNHRTMASTKKASRNATA